LAHFQGEPIERFDEKKNMRLLISCISTKHSVLKQHWARSSQETSIECPLTILGSYEKPKEDLGGALCLIGDMGCAQKTLELALAAGMALSENGVFVTTFDGIHEIDSELGGADQHVISSPLFNALHSISRTRRGYLVASTGLDLLLEFNREGEILWSWWATDHGFELTPAGHRRVLDKSADHRTMKYGTLNQTTHVNSAAQLPDGSVLASLFHQGMIIVIDRESGGWRPVLEGLDHPHAVRVLDEEHFTVADTAHGKALLARINHDGGHVEQEIDAGTNWLQDCRYDSIHNCWVLVDGKNSRVSLLRGHLGERAFAHFDFDPEWRLYEAQLI
jgi:hypothetical protein